MCIVRPVQYLIAEHWDVPGLELNMATCQLWLNRKELQYLSTAGNLSFPLQYLVILIFVDALKVSGPNNGSVDQSRNESASFKNSALILTVDKSD